VTATPAELMTEVERAFAKGMRELRRAGDADTLNRVGWPDGSRERAGILHDRVQVAIMAIGEAIR
jgi:hypothetical protein